MNNLIIRTKDQEILLKTTETYDKFIDLLGTADSIKRLTDKYNKTDALEDNAMETYVIELLDDIMTLTVFKRDRWTGDNMLDWKRNYHMIWNLKKN
jgi:predicted ATP-grasp superfamily ATP-dependent carboligase